jgi:hypothetical protein
MDGREAGTRRRAEYTGEETSMMDSDELIREERGLVSKDVPTKVSGNYKSFDPPICGRDKQEQGQYRSKKGLESCQQWFTE